MPEPEKGMQKGMGVFKRGGKRGNSLGPSCFVWSSQGRISVEYSSALGVSPQGHCLYCLVGIRAGDH